MRSWVGLQVRDSREPGRDTRRHTCACSTSYITTVRSSEHVSTFTEVIESSRKLSLIARVCALHVLCDKWCGKENGGFFNNNIDIKSRKNDLLMIHRYLITPTYLKGVRLCLPMCL